MESSDSPIVLHKPGALDAKSHIVFKYHISGTLVEIVAPAAIAKALDVSAQVVDDRHTDGGLFTFGGYYISLSVLG